jgi:hypothetical protein
MVKECDVITDHRWNERMNGKRGMYTKTNTELLKVACSNEGEMGLATF